MGFWLRACSKIYNWNWMLINPPRFIADVPAWRHYCPVTLPLYFAQRATQSERFSWHSQPWTCRPGLPTMPFSALHAAFSALEKAFSALENPFSALNMSPRTTYDAVLSTSRGVLSSWKGVLSLENSATNQNTPFMVFLFRYLDLF